MKKHSFLTLALALLCAYSNSIIAQDMTAKHKAAIQNAYDALNRKDWAAFALTCAPEFTDLNVGPAPAVGVEAAIGLYKQFQTAFPDFTIKINEIVPAGPARYLLRVTVTGTNTGPFMMLPPTGKSMKFDDVDIVVLDKNSKAISHTITHMGEPLRQIGYGSMNNPNTHAVIAIYEKFGQGDVAGILAGCTDDVVFDIQDRIFDTKGRMFKGKAEVGGFFKELSEKMKYSKFQPVRFVADGDDVFVRLEVAFEHLPSGDQYTSAYTHHFKVANGKVSFFRGGDDFPVKK